MDNLTLDLRDVASSPLILESHTKLQLQVTTGIGTGPNELAAFDSALFAAGIANFNLIYLSSVIPQGSTLVRERPELSERYWGHRLYVVMAQHRTSVVGDEAWAGIGWVQNEDDGRGLFVEHHGESADEVQELIDGSLTSMVKYRDTNFGPIQSQIVGTVCEDEPACALTAVVYGSEPWNVVTVPEMR